MGVLASQQQAQAQMKALSISNGSTPANDTPTNGTPTAGTPTTENFGPFGASEIAAAGAVTDAVPAAKDPVANGGTGALPTVDGSAAASTPAG